ncbi:MAG TPA: ABC transporter permease [Patescibacteria group bacterium]|nr:ABC transporter permease [Patescibacteria group bacterium]
MSIPFFIARRYIFSRRTLHFISLITTISFLGITVGVAALICVTSIFNGFRGVVESMLIGFDPHIRISAKKGAFLNNPDELLQSIKNMPEVSAASPVLQGRMIALQGNSPQVFNLTAMRQEDVNSVSGVASTVIIGKFNLGIGDFPAVVLGAGLADRLRALPSDTITLVSPRMIESALASMSRPKGIKVIVSGIFQANAREYDNTVGYTSAQLGQQLLKAGEKDATSIDIRLHSINSVVAVQKSLQTSLPQNIIVETWYDLHKELYDVMQLERLASFVVLSLVIVVAVFNVLASLSMTVFEKRADIAMLKSMGASDNFIQRIYLLEGLSIGILGTLAGVVLGLALCFGQIHFGWIKLDTSKYILAALPLSVHFSDVIAVIIVTLLLSFLATIFPSKRAAQTQIAAALRRE